MHFDYDGKPDVQQLSLGDAAMVLLGSLPKGPMDDCELVQWRVRRGLLNWYRLVHHMFRDHDGSGISSKLSRGQIKSFCLLWEWWTGRYQDSKLSRSLIDTMIDTAGGLRRCQQDFFACLESDESASDRIDHWNLVQVKLGPHPTLVSSLEVAENATPLLEYNDYIKIAFVQEFFKSRIGNFYCSDFVSVIPPSLNTARQHLSTRTYLQASFLFLHHSLSNGEELGDQSQSLLARAQSTPPWYKLGASSPTVEPCAWLATDVSNITDCPYYLWDIFADEVVVTQNLDAFPEYAVISHTWGRWISKSGSKAEVANVPWHIPENDVFEVREIPQLLSRLQGKCGTRYVWLDLVCIPQDGGSIARDEIGKQAAIFRLASCSIAWLHEFDDLTSLELFCKWMALGCGRFYEESREEQSRQNFESKFWKEFEEHRQQQSWSSESEFWSQLLPTYWSTSLWTLQEVCLRPDMWICDKDLGFLALHNESPISISGFVAFLHSMCRRAPVENNEDQRNIASQALSWLAGTGLLQLNELSQMDILNLGQARECTSSRAEAVMSAIGATAWYKLRDTSANGSTEVSIFDQYPISFLREVCAMDPGSFFGCFKCFCRFKDQTSTKELPQGESDDLHVPNLILTEGSMLPINRIGTLSLKLMDSLNPGSCLDSIRGWTILPHGAVRISDVCVLSSPEIVRACPRLPDIGVYISGIKTAGAPEFHTPEMTCDYLFTIDLHRYVRTRSWPAYFVVLSFDVTPSVEDCIIGIILWEQSQTQQEDNRTRRGDCLLRRQTFLKVANFKTNFRPKSFELPPTTKVDWIVL